MEVEGVLPSLSHLRDLQSVCLRVAPSIMGNNDLCHMPANTSSITNLTLDGTGYGVRQGLPTLANLRQLNLISDEIATPAAAFPPGMTALRALTFLKTTLRNIARPTMAQLPGLRFLAVVDTLPSRTDNVRLPPAISRLTSLSRLELGKGVFLCLEISLVPLLTKVVTPWDGDDEHQRALLRLSRRDVDF